MKVIDLFCGCGGLSLGFQLAGFSIEAAFDNWDKAISVYKENFKHDVYLQDISDTLMTKNIIRNYNFDMIIGGPPCQDFSSAGKRDESLGRADLTYSYADVVNSMNPKWFVMENVDKIRNSDILNNIVQNFKTNDYGLTAVILDASLCGVPQSRKRFFLIGEKGGKHNSLLPILKKNLSNQKMTIHDYLRDDFGIEYYYRHPRNYSRRGIFSINEPSPTVRGVNRPMPKDYFTKNCPKLDKNIDTTKIRPLTTIERSYLQTFPKEFIFNGTKTNLEQIIGNAVPPNLAKFIALAIIEYVNNHQGILKDVDEFLIPQGVLKR